MKLNYLDVDNENEYLYTSQLPKSSWSRTRVRVNIIFGRLDAVDEEVCEKWCKQVWEVKHVIRLVLMVNAVKINQKIGKCTWKAKCVSTLNIEC